MVLAWVVLAAMASLPLPAAPAPRRVEVTEAIVRLGDLTSLTDLPLNLRARAAATPILSLRPGAAATLTGDQIQAGARRRMPLLAAWRPGDDAVVIVRRAAARRSPPEAACVRLERPVGRGQVLTRADFVREACGAAGAAPAAWRYDRAAQALRADRDLSVGDTLASPPETLVAVLRPGQTVRVTARLGAVTVERDALAVQAARAGRPVFVKSGGDLFAVAALEPAR